MDGRTARRAERQAAVQAHGLRLFAERGFANVTIDAIAAAAGVSAQSVYNYFGTKPGIVLQGADDDQIAADAVAAIAAGATARSGLLAALTASSGRAAGVRLTRERVRWMLDEPEIRAAWLMGADAMAEELAAAACARPVDPTSRAEALPEAAAAVARTVGALKAWYRDGRNSDPREAMIAALA